MADSMATLESMDANQTFSYIPDIIALSIGLNSTVHQRLMESQADHCIYLDISQFDIMDFKSTQKIIAMGYESAKKQLDGLDKV